MASPSGFSPATSTYFGHLGLLCNPSFNRVDAKRPECLDSDRSAHTGFRQASPPPSPHALRGIFNLIISPPFASDALCNFTSTPASLASACVLGPRRRCDRGIGFGAVALKRGAHASEAQSSRSAFGMRRAHPEASVASRSLIGGGIVCCRSA